MKTTGMLKFEMLAVVAFATLLSCRNIQECQAPQVTVSAELMVPGMACTKSVLPTGIEGKIESVTWAAYDCSSGALILSGYSQPHAVGSYVIDLMLPEGHSYDLYAMANIGDLRERIPAREELMNDFDIMLPDEFSDLSATGLPMAGHVPGVEPCGAQAAVEMKSLVAVYHVAVNVKNLDLELSTGERRRVMQGEYMHVKNSNRHLEPFSSEGSKARTADDVAAGDADASFCAIVPLDNAMTQTADSVFSYLLYVPENVQGVLLPGNSDPDMKVPSEVDRVNGPGMSERLTYLEFSFDKTESADSNPFMGDIIYRMYLGNDNCSDFTVEGGRVNSLYIEFDAESLLSQPFWKVDHGSSWNNMNECLEFSGHDLTVTPAQVRKLFVWYSGTGVSLEDAIPRVMGILRPDNVKAAVRNEWFFEEDAGGGESLPGFTALWDAGAIRYVASAADKTKSSDVIDRYYIKYVDSMMGRTAMLVASDKWHFMRDTCYVHFTGEITMNSSDFNNFRVAQERILKVSGLPADEPATCVFGTATHNVVIEDIDTGAGTATKTWRIKAMQPGNTVLRVEAGGVSASFTISVLPVYIGIMRAGSGLQCALDGAHTACSYAYYADAACSSELSEGSFVPELKESLLSPRISIQGQYAPLLEYTISGRQIYTYISSYSSGGTRFEGCRGEKQLGTLTVSPAYSSSVVSTTKIFLKSYRSYDLMGNIGTLTDASGYEPEVLAKVPGGLPGDYRTHVNMNGHSSFQRYCGSPIVNSAGIGKPELWSVGLFSDSGEECTSVRIGNISAYDVWTNGSANGQCGKSLTARLAVRNMNSGEVFTEDLFKLDSTVMVCMAGAYCNETGIYGKSSLYEVSDHPETFYNSVTGATDWHDKMILIQRDEWNSFVSWGGKIKKYLTYADDFVGIPANASYKKTKYNLAAGLCFDTYADCLGDYSSKVNSAFATLCNSAARFITGTVETRNTYVEFDSSAATQIVLLKFHPSLYFSLLAYHSDDNRRVSDLRKREEVYTSSHYDGVDDHLVPLSETRSFPLRTQVQHVFYGDVEDGLCNNQPWRVDFNHRSPASIASWYGNQDVHVPFSLDGDSSVDELIGQFAPDLTFSIGAGISGMSFSDGKADYVSSDGTHLRMFFLHEVLKYSGEQTRYTWKNWY